MLNTISMKLNNVMKAVRLSPEVRSCSYELKAKGSRVIHEIKIDVAIEVSPKDASKMASEVERIFEEALELPVMTVLFCSMIEEEAWFQVLQF